MSSSNKYFIFKNSRRRQKSTTPHTPVAPPYHDTVTIDSDNDDYDRGRRDYWHEPHHMSADIMVIPGTEIL